MDHDYIQVEMITWTGKGLTTTQGRPKDSSGPGRGMQIGRILIVSLFLLFSSIQGIDVKPQKELYVPNYRFYHNLKLIDDEIQYLLKFPNYVKLFSQYRSRQNRPQYLLHICNFTEIRRKKPQILFSYGEHAREFLPVESAIFFLRNLTGGLLPHADLYSKQFTQRILSQSDLYIILMANPDGRHYIEQTSNYCWRGTSSGVDLDRNFDWEFGGKGSTGNTQDEEYRGNEPFSGTFKFH